LFQQGIISANSQVQQADGYGLIYTNNTLPGMSGGPVLNSQGELIGIHGKGETERQQGTQVSEVVVKVGYNLGIPINTFLDLAPRAGINLPLANRPTPAPVAATNIPRPVRVDDFIAEGSNKLHRGDYPGAIAAFDRAIASDASAADAYRLRASARMSEIGWSVAESKSPRNRERVLAAQADLNEAIRLNPNLSEAFAIRGYLRFVLGNQSGALNDVDSALRLNPKNGAALIVRSTIKGENGDHRGAIADATEAIQLDPNSPYLNFAYNNRGLARANLRDFEGALPDLTQAIRLAPKNALSYIVRGQVRAAMGDRAGGLMDLQQGANLAVEQNNSALHRQAIQAIQSLQMRQRLGL
jgi:tetratricopeptide (TPR) repeat protein